MGTHPANCVNHPDAPTRLSCSQCEAPICGRCARSSPVGQRCPSCAAPARTARARGKPEHYARAIGAGLPLAFVGGLLVTQVAFGALIMSGILGFGVGRAVAWGTRGQTQPPFPALAVTVAVVGLLVAFVLVYQTPVPSGGLRALAYPLAGWFALRGLAR